MWCPNNFTWLFVSHENLHNVLPEWNIWLKIANSLYQFFFFIDDVLLMSVSQ